MPWLCLNPRPLDYQANTPLRHQGRPDYLLLQDVGSETKVPNLHMVLIINEYVDGLQIPMYYTLRVNVTQTFNDLP